MGIAVEGIAGYETADYIRSIVPADGYLKYYIGTAGTWRGGAMDSKETESIRQNMEYIDDITGLAWKEVYNASEAQIFFYKAGPEYYDDPDTIGLTEFGTPDNGITVTWLDEPGDPSSNGEGITIKHEIGHVAALEHPYGDGYNSSYHQDDTIMSYNSPPDRMVNWTDSDKLAMKAIWGEDRKTFVPGRGTHVGTVFADQFYLKDFDGYGEGSADIIQGFNAANGDKLQFTTNGVGWDPAKQYYSFWVASNSQEQYISGYESQRVKTFRWNKGKRRVKWTTKEVPVYGERETSNVDTIVTRSDNNNLIYNKSTGQLFVDRNGSAYGLGDGGLVAILQGAPALSTDNISWFTS
jgi:hypothetical protein